MKTNRIFRRAFIAFLLSAVCLAACVSPAGAYDLAAAEKNLEEHGLVLDEVLAEFYDSFKGRAYGLLLQPPESEGPGCLFADVTGDGCVDLCRGRMFGSGMVRMQINVYDPLSRELYVLDGYNYDYLCAGVTDGRLDVLMVGPNGYGDPLTESRGTVELRDGVLVFVPDPENGGPVPSGKERFDYLRIRNP